MKPVIKKVGVLWACTFEGAVASGDTPAEAYDEFRKLFKINMEPTLLERLSGEARAGMMSASLFNELAQRRHNHELTMAAERAAMASSQFWNEEVLTNERPKYNFEKVGKDAKS